MTSAPPLVAGWAPNTSVFGAQWADLPEAVRDAALRASVNTLWALSGRQFAVLDVTLAPYLPAARPSARTEYGRVLSAGAGRTPLVPGGVQPSRAFRLPGGAVSVTRVELAGEELPASAWTLDPDGTLVRLDGAWPAGQDVYAPVWTVRYLRGQAAPDDANLAAGRYALELAKAMHLDPATPTPTRTRDAARQKIDRASEDAEERANEGLTGVPVVDKWLRAVNPHRLAATPFVWSPDTDRHRIITVHA